MKNAWQIVALAAWLVAGIAHGQDAAPSSSHSPPVPPPPPAAPGVVVPKPKAISTITPEYPAAERAAGHSGRVVLHFKVTETGAIESVEVKTGTGYPALDAAALEAGRKWRFEAAKDEAGKPVASEASYALKFSAEGSGGGVARTCSDINNEVRTFRATSPEADIGQMKSFAAMTGVFFLSTADEPMDKRLAIVKRLKEVYPKIVARCESEPEASYSDVFAEEFMRLKKAQQ